MHSSLYSIRYRSSSSLRIAGCCTTARRYSTLLLGPVFEAIRGGGEQQRRVDPGRDRACLLCVYLHFTLLRTMCAATAAAFLQPTVNPRSSTRISSRTAIFIIRSVRGQHDHDGPTALQPRSRTHCRRVCSSPAAFSTQGCFPSPAPFCFDEWQKGDTHPPIITMIFTHHRLFRPRRRRSRARSRASGHRSTSKFRERLAPMHPMSLQTVGNSARVLRKRAEAVGNF